MHCKMQACAKTCVKQMRTLPKPSLSVIPVVPHPHRGESFEHNKTTIARLDDGWPESEKDVFQAALRMVVVKDSR